MFNGLEDNWPFCNFIQKTAQPSKTNRTRRTADNDLHIRTDLVASAIRGVHPALAPDEEGIQGVKSGVVLG